MALMEPPHRLHKGGGAIEGGLQPLCLPYFLRRPQGDLRSSKASRSDEAIWPQSARTPQPPLVRLAP